MNCSLGAKALVGEFLNSSVLAKMKISPKDSGCGPEPWSRPLSAYISAFWRNDSCVDGFDENR